MTENNEDRDDIEQIMEMLTGGGHTECGHADCEKINDSIKRIAMANPKTSDLFGKTVVLSLGKRDSDEIARAIIETIDRVAGKRALRRVSVESDYGPVAIFDVIIDTEEITHDQLTTLLLEAAGHHEALVDPSRAPDFIFVSTGVSLRDTLFN